MLGPIPFLFYINDIVENVEGIIKLFADDYQAGCRTIIRIVISYRPWRRNGRLNFPPEKERERERERERNVLFNDALNTFYLRLYGVRHMVKAHSDSEKGNPLPPHRLLID